MPVVTSQALQGALVTLTLIFDLPIFRSQDANETAQILIYAGRRLARLQDDALHWRIKKSKRKRTQQIRILATLPGIGSDRAYRLLDHFGTVQSCITASAAELQEVAGIGPKTQPPSVTLLVSRPSRLRNCNRILRRSRPIVPEPGLLTNL